ncbi:MAG TPA: NAD-dependent epimerase/dehydratase family protein [Stellaceae bacterium]|jgi:GDP-L-fucose synthase|nr:NAD-dependent epimerase/dehydratase family protein [Stellaceae bacterium]
MSFYSGRSVLVTGGTGLIGRALVAMLLELGAKVRVASLDAPSRAPAGCEFRHVDLREFAGCLAACQGVEFVFHLAGVKGSPAMTAQQPASFFVPTLSFNTNMMEAARRCGVERYLFTSSIGVYAPAEVFYEDDVWSTFPSPNDRFAGWAKRMGELQAEAYQIEYGWDKVSIVRPANVYGPYDNFDPKNAMVIPSLVHRALAGENPLVVWGDGSAVRDFIHARDVARGMVLVIEKGYSKPVNLGSGTGVSVREIADIVAREIPSLRIEWDVTKPSGDAKRLMDVRRAESIGFRPEIAIADGIAATIRWYRDNRGNASQRYNAFTEFTHP